MAAHLPLGRRDDLLVDELEDETLVYDHRAKKALCLNRSSSVIWKMCDGKTSVPEMTRRATDALGTPVDEPFVRYALDGLAKQGLLDRALAGSEQRTGLSREEAIRRAGVALAFGIPLISWVMTPTPARAYGKNNDPGEDDNGDDKNGKPDNNGDDHNNDNGNG